MNRSPMSVIVALGLISLASSAFAQSPLATPQTQLDNGAGNDRSDAKAEAERIRKERQAQARSLLISLASDARNFRDQALRARSLTRIADALWDVDAEPKRAVFYFLMPLVNIVQGCDFRSPSKSRIHSYSGCAFKNAAAIKSFPHGCPIAAQNCIFSAMRLSTTFACTVPPG